MINLKNIEKDIPVYIFEDILGNTRYTPQYVAFGRVCRAIATLSAKAFDEGKEFLDKNKGYSAVFSLNTLCRENPGKQCHVVFTVNPLPIIEHIKRKTIEEVILSIHQHDCLRIEDIRNMHALLDEQASSTYTGKDSALRVILQTMREL